MGELSNLSGIGEVTEKMLNMVGIFTKEELSKIGSKEALLKIRLGVDDGACLNMLYGLETAVQGLQRGGLSEESKADLKEFYSKL